MLVPAQLPPPREPLARPIVALSAGVMQVYQGINNKFYQEQRSRGVLGGRPTYNRGFDDSEGHYIHIVGEKIADRYTVEGELGKGSFGTVLRCCDEKYQENCAMKIIRSGAYFEAQGRLEMEIVLYLNQLEELQNLVMQLRKAFYWQGHIVLVFELLSNNLFELIKCTHYNGVSLDLTRKFAFQLAQVLLQLNRHRPRIIHSDLKPENVVLKDRKRSGIRVIDFGSACYQLMGEWVMPLPRVPLPDPHNDDDDDDEGGRYNNTNPRHRLMDDSSSSTIYADGDHGTDALSVVTTNTLNPTTTVTTGGAPVSPRAVLAAAAATKGITGSGGGGGSGGGDSREGGGPVTVAATTPSAKSSSRHASPNHNHHHQQQEQQGGSGGGLNAAAAAAVVRKADSHNNCQDNPLDIHQQQQQQQQSTQAQHPSYNMMPKYVQSRFYRCPEVILELGYTTAIDRWSLGCMLVELHTGVPLFPGLNEVEMIGYFTAILGPLPDEMICASPKMNLFYFDTRTAEGAAGVEAMAQQEQQQQQQQDGGGGSVKRTAKAAFDDGEWDDMPLALHSNSSNTSEDNNAAPTSAAVQGKRSYGSSSGAGGGGGGGGERHHQQQQQEHNPQEGVTNQPTPSSESPPPTVAPVSSSGAASSADAAATTTKAAATAAVASAKPQQDGTTDKSMVQQEQHQEGGDQLGCHNNRHRRHNHSSSSPFVLRHPPRPEWCRGLVDIIGVYTGGPRGCRQSQPSHDVAAYLTFLDFVHSLLAYDPRQRIDCAEALEHTFLGPLRDLDRRAAAAAQQQWPLAPA